MTEFQDRPLPEIALEEIAHKVGIHLEAALGERQRTIEAKVDKAIEAVNLVGLDVAVSNERVRTHFTLDSDRHLRHDQEFKQLWQEFKRMAAETDRRLQPLEDKQLIQNTVLRFSSKTLMLVGGTVLAALGALGFAIIQQLRATFGW